MHIILGGTGHLGSAAATALLAQGEPVTIVTRDASRQAEWIARGAEVGVADINDTAALARVIARGRTLYVVNPPADPAGDTDAAERRTARSILAAVDGSGLDRIVAASTYGARPGERIGDLSVLHELEQGLAAQAVPTTIIRGAYYYSNWDVQLASAREGVLTSFFPADFMLPMVAPGDLGAVAARLLADPATAPGIRFVEGPRRLSAADVAAAFSAALRRDVRVEVVTRDRWIETYRTLGFSPEAADAYARMTGATLDSDDPGPPAPTRAATTIEEHVATLVGNPPAG